MENLEEIPLYIEIEKPKISRKEYLKEYCRQRKDKYGEHIICECGKTITRWNKATHKKSIFHLNIMKIKELENYINSHKNQ